MEYLVNFELYWVLKLQTASRHIFSISAYKNKTKILITK